MSNCPEYCPPSPPVILKSNRITLGVYSAQLLYENHDKSEEYDISPVLDLIMDMDNANTCNNTPTYLQTYNHSFIELSGPLICNF